jgi:undecaprenyl-phosphate galactose phosphotransferase/putative colanic acid biosynthesis UDP-glucose lipid carrier transferase
MSQSYRKSDSFAGLLKYSTGFTSSFALFIIIFFCFVFVSRIFFNETHEGIRAQGYNYKSVIIVGVNDREKY